MSALTIPVPLGACIHREWGGGPAFFLAQRSMVTAVATSAGEGTAGMGTRGRTASLPAPTIGVLPCGRWRAADRLVEIAPGERVRLGPHQAEIVVQAVGCALPTWAKPRHRLVERPDLELMLLREAAWAREGKPRPERLDAFTPQHRFVLHDRASESALAAKGALPWADLLVGADASDFEAVAEALALLLTGELLMCVDLADVLLAAGAGPRRTGRGRAVAIEGLGDEDTGAALAERRRALERHGFDGGLLLVQLVAERDRGQLTLDRLDRFAAAAIGVCDEQEHPVAFTATAGASRTAAILVAFRAPRGGRNEVEGA